MLGIEARGDLVDAARANLKTCAQGSAEFIAGDVFEVLGREQPEADVVLCLGYLYHTLRYSELMHRIREVNPRHLVVDTQVVPRVRRPFVHLQLDLAERQRDAVLDPYAHGSKTLVGWPSVPALRLILESYGFEIEGFSDWGSLLRDNPALGGVSDYATGRRVTVRCVSAAG